MTRYERFGCLLMLVSGMVMGWLMAFLLDRLV
jgi:hypothetical protein